MTEQIKIDIKSDEFDKIPALFQQAVTRTLELAASILMGHMVDEVPVVHGRLKGSISPPIRLDDMSYGINIGAEYWKYIQFGTKPHDIEPKDKKGWLVFEVEGQTVFAKKVRHPGSEPNPFIDRAIDKTESDIPDIISFALKEVGL